MRIEFVHADLPDHPWPGGTLRIGSAADNDVSLRGRGVADHHVALFEDVRGLVLEVCPGAGHVYVNARPVREKALLRLGDSLGIGNCHLRLVADDMRREADADDTGAFVRHEGVMALRAVAGPLSGRVFALESRLELDERGPTSRPGMANAMVLRRQGRHVCLDAAGLPEGRTAIVNGIRTRQALLDDGDQIVLGMHRFVLDVSMEALPTAEPAPAAEAPDTARPERHGIRPEMWLVVTAAALALVLAGVLLVHY